MSGLGRCRICGATATVRYPLLPSHPAFCNKHHNARDAGHFGADFSGPDDFDIPFEGEDYHPDLTREMFQWRDGKGYQHPLWTIDDRYLANIVGFLERKLDGHNDSYWEAVLDFLRNEQTIRAKENPWRLK